MSDKKKPSHPTLTERVERVAEQVLSGERPYTPGLRDKSLTPLEQQRFEELAQILREAAARGEYVDNLDEELWRFDYLKRPPGIKDFVLDEYYLGRTWKPVPGENEGIWPEWLALMEAHMDIESRIHNMVITGSLGIGKCWCAGTRVVMFDGTLRKVEDVFVGDVLLGDDSTPRTVLSTTQGNGLLYEIQPVKGEPFTVNGEHVLVLKSTKSNVIEEVTVNDFLQWPRERKHCACLYRTAVDWPEQETLIDPYIMGLWLGDGHTTQTVLTTADPEIREAWIAYGQMLGLTANIYTAGKGAKAVSIQLSYRDVDGTLRKYKNELRNRLIQLGLFQTTPVPGTEKFIPQCFLANSRSKRLHLLAGLLDTDGSKCVKAGEGSYEITLKIKKLSDQVRFLAQSLGYYAVTKIKVVNSTAYYRTFISGAYDVPVRLPRKKSGDKPSKRISNLTGNEVCFDNSKTRFAVTPVGIDKYYGFTLTGDGRCLLEDFTVTHNTVMMVTLILYRLCIATYLKNPQHFFGLNRNSNIVYNVLSVTKEAVKDTAFGTAMTFMSDSPYFLEVCRYNPELDYSGYRIPMENTLPDGRSSRIWLTAGSKGQHVLGRNLVGIGLDEGNFRLEKDPDLKAYELYDQVRTRISNRFQKIAGFLPALSIIASSAADESSFTEKVVGEIEEQNRQLALANRQLPPNVEPEPVSQVVFRNAVYKIKRHALTGIGPDHHWFRVTYGLKNMEPYILSGWYREDGTPIGEQPHEEPPAGAKTELVPKFYWEAYRRNCKAQLQNLSGISVGGAHRLFPSLVDVEHCLQLSSQEGVPSPLITGVQRLPISAEDNKNIWDYLNHKNFLTRVQSRIQPIRHPQNQRYAHIDLATQSLAGVAICHLAGSQLIEGLVKNGEPFSEYRLTVEYDFILTICAGQSKPINIGKIQKFFFWLRDMCGYRFGLITADMFQCLTADTLVDTDHGILPINEVKAGYLVQDVNGLPAKVTGNVCYRAVPVIRIVTDHNETICGTPNHRLRAAENCQRPHTNARYDWRMLAELEPGHIVDMVTAPVVVQGKQKISRAEWLGIYWGDGCIKTGGSISVTCCKQNVAEYAAIAQKATGIVPKIYWSTNNKSAEVSVHSRKLARWLIKNGYRKAPQKSGKPAVEIGLPDAILKANRKTQAAFLRGLFSADGGVDDLGTVSLATKHAKLAQQVAVMLRTQFGLRSNIVRSYREGFGKRRVQWIVQVGGSRQTFYASIGFCFSDKQTKLLQHISKKGRRLVSRIARIEHGVADVYDLEVEGTHSYTANGFISHNSEMPLQELEARNFKVGKLSVDKDKSVYTAWRAGFEEHRIRLHRNEQMIREAENLLEMDKKFDHPPDGSKDTVDAAAGAFFNAVSSDEKLTLVGQNAPSLYTGQSVQQMEQEAPPVSIPLPAKGYLRSKVFKV